MSEEKSAELQLAEAVAEKTVERVMQSFKGELEARDAALREFWQKDLGKLRDDLTVKGLLNDMKSFPPPDATAKPIRVLVVDDYPEIRKVFMKAFAAAGMDVVQAASGTAAAEILEADHGVEVVVTDVAMPKNGYTLLEHVRLTYPGIEVIMTSGYETEAGRARQLGAFGFLPKPFSLGQAVLLVERAAEFRRLKLAASRG